jgi:hypothetical protein
MEKLTDFFNSLIFSTPLYLWIAGALVLLLIFLPWFGRKKRLAIDLQYWGDKVKLKSGRFMILSIPVLITSVLLVGVLSNPQITEKSITYIYGYPVMIVIDISGSMGTGTSQRTGYEESLEVFNDLVARRGDINFGLLLYSTENYVARYFINKNELFLDTLENKDEIVEISMGTRPTEALTRARQFLEENIEGENKAIIFISDLNVSGQTRLDVAEEMTMVSLAGINLYIIATGEEKNRAVEIPQMSGLKVVDMDDKDAIDLICEEIYEMQISPIREEEEGLMDKSLIPYLILPALGIIGLCLVLGETRYRKIP